MLRLARPCFLLFALWLAGCAMPQRVAQPLTARAARYQHDVATLASPRFEGRAAGTRGNRLARDWLVDQFRAIGLHPAFNDSYLQPFALKSGSIVHNIGGYLPGHGAMANKVLILGAHFDHLGFGGPSSFSYVHALHPGADDNASGCAGLLLLARRYAQRVTTSSAPADRCAILFLAFNAEELQMLGSKYFVAHLNTTRWLKPRIITMFNMDMIGRLRNDMLYVFGTETRPDWPTLLAPIIASTRLHLRLFATPDTASDQRPFAEAGIPVLQFFTGKHEDYHRITDTPDKINAQGAVRVLNVVDELIRELWTKKLPIKNHTARVAPP